MLLKRDIIVTGDQLIDAVTAATDQGPGVSITLDNAGGEEMLRTTRANLGKPMGVVFIEQRREEVDIDGRKVQRDIKEEKVISVASVVCVVSIATARQTDRGVHAFCRNAHVSYYFISQTRRTMTIFLFNCSSGN